MTDEDVATVEGWLGKRKPTFPIVILDGKLEAQLGVRAFPTAAVISPEGRIVYVDRTAGNEHGSAESALKAALKEAEKGSVWPKDVQEAVQLAVSGKKAEAYAELAELRASGSEDVKPAAEKVATWIEGEAAAALEQARKDAEAGLVLRAVQGAEQYAKAKTPLPASADAAKLLAELEAMPAFKDELKAGEMFAEGQALEQELEYTKACEAYKKLLKRYGETKAAGPAKAAAQRLIDEGMPGYAKACQACQTGRRACAKHAEVVKL